MKRFITAILLGLAISSVQAAGAVPTGAVQVGSDDVFVTKTSGGTFTCASIGSKWLPGTLDRQDSSYFLSFQAQVRTLKAKVRKAIGRKKSSLQKKLTSLQGRAKKGNAACKNGPSGPGSPTPTPVSGNFDASGNLTAQGKATFGVPSNLSGNITSGKNVHTTKCQGCHGDKPNKSFSQYRSLTSASPMFFSTADLPDSELANITAYLNRFRQ